MRNTPKPREDALFISLEGRATGEGNKITGFEPPSWMAMKTVGTLTTLSCKTCTGFITLADGMAMEDIDGRPVLPPLLHDKSCPRMQRLQQVADVDIKVGGTE